LDAPFFATLFRVDHVENGSNALLLFLNLDKSFLPRDVLVEEDDTTRGIDFVTFAEGLSDYLDCLDGAKEGVLHFLKELLLGDIHSLVEKGIFVCSFLPPHGIHLGHSAPEGSGHCCHVLLVDLVNSVIVGIHVDNQILIDLLSDFLNDGLIEDGLEGQFFLFPLED
jgi:hypothetical protein